MFRHIVPETVNSAQVTGLLCAAGALCAIPQDQLFHVQDQHAQATRDMQAHMRQVEAQFEAYQALKAQEIAALEERVCTMLQNGTDTSSVLGSDPAGPQQNPRAQPAHAKAAAQPSAAGRLASSGAKAGKSRLKKPKVGTTSSGTKPGREADIRIPSHPAAEPQVCLS